MIATIVEQLAEMLSIRKYWWAHFFGATFVLFSILFSIMVIRYSPRDVLILMKHAGIYSADLRVVGLFLFAWVVLYTLFFLNIKKVVHNKPSMRIILLWTVIVIAVMFVTPPFFSSDLYGYISRASISNIHQVTPYAPTPAELGYEEVVAWPYGGLVYGPVFASYITIVNKFVGTNVIANLFVFRMIGVISFFLCALLLYQIMKITNPGYLLSGAALFLMNPFFQVEIIHSAHNDVFMLLGILVFIYLLLQKKYNIAMVPIAVTFLIKFGTIVLAPVLWLLIMRQTISIIKKLKQIVLSVILFITMVVLFYIPFWENFFGNVTHSGLVFIGASYLTLPQSIVYIIVLLTSNFISNQAVLVQLSSALKIIMFALWYGGLLFFVRQWRDSLIVSRIFWVLMALLLLLGGKLNIWYLLWAAPLVLLIPKPFYRVMLILLTVHGFLYYAWLNVFFPNTIVSVIAILVALVMSMYTKKPSSLTATS